MVNADMAKPLKANLGRTGRRILPEREQRLDRAAKAKFAPALMNTPGLLISLTRRRSLSAMAEKLRCLAIPLKAALIAFDDTGTAVQRPGIMGGGRRQQIQSTFTPQETACTKPQNGGRHAF